MITAFLKSNPLTSWIIAGAAALLLLGGGYALTRQNVPPVSVAQPEVTPKVEKQAEASQIPQVKEVDEVEKAAELAEPRFDLLRVEPDGSLLIAGTATSKAKVEIVSGGGVIAATLAGESGDFVAILDKPLDPGSYELTIRITRSDGGVVESAETGIVSIPSPGGELLAMVAKPGEATRDVQLSQDSEKVESEPKTAGKGEIAEIAPGVEAEEAAKPEPTAEASAQETVKIEPAVEEASKDTVIAAVEADKAATAESDKAATVAPAEADKSSTVSPAGDAEQSVETAAATPDSNADVKVEEAQPLTEIRPVLLQAADVENGKLFIAGVGEPGYRVNLYLNGGFLGAAAIGSEGSFLLEAARELAAGSYEIRADMISPGGGEVVRRAAVELIHESPRIQTAEQEPAQPADTAAKESAKVAEAAKQEPAQVAESVAKQPVEVAEANKQDPAQAPESAAKQPVETGEPAKVAEAAKQEPAQAAESAAKRPVEIGEPAKVAEAANQEPAQAAENAAKEPAEASEPAKLAEAAKQEPAQVAESAAKQPVETGEPAKVAEAAKQEPAQAAESVAKQPAQASEPAEVAEAVKQEPAQAVATQVLVAPPSQSVIKLAQLRTGESVIIRRGDNLWRISRRMLGAGIRYTTIWQANRAQIRDPDLIFPGQVFKVPDTEQG